jgi:hypothetical protein
MNEKHRMKENTKIYCCCCEREVDARLTDGSEIYQHRKDLKDIPFWKCDDCGNYVGCHHKTKNKFYPLGCIPTKEIMEGRKQLHYLIDPIWKNGKIKRKDVYSIISREIGYEYHAANTRTLSDILKIKDVVLKLRLKIGLEN